MVKKSTIIAILAAVGTLAITLAGTIMNELFASITDRFKDFISAPPETLGISAKDGENQIVGNNTSIASRSITFTFNADNTDAHFECSLDGEPFELCLSPKHYGNLPTDSEHTFQVRAKGILGNPEHTPLKFNVRAFTSAIVSGVVKNAGGDPLPNIKIFISHIGNTTTDVRNTTTDDIGGFYFEKTEKGAHFLSIAANNGTKYINFPIPEGAAEKSLDISLNKLPSLDSAGSPNTIINESEINKQYSKSESTPPITYNVTLMQDGKNTGPNSYFAKVWVEAPNETLSKIDNVTYYLHPTFNPSVILGDSSSNKFGISFTGWGVFNLKAKVYFKDDEVRDLELPKDKWIFTQ